MLHRAAIESVAWVGAGLYVQHFNFENQCGIRLDHATGAAPATAGSGNVVVVLNSRDATITLLDQLTYKEINTFPVGKESHHLMPTPDNKSLIVLPLPAIRCCSWTPRAARFRARSRISSIRTRSVFRPTRSGSSPTVCGWIASTSYGYDGNHLKLAKCLPLPAMPSHMAFSADSATAFITLQGSDQLAAVDLSIQQVKWAMPAGKQPASHKRSTSPRPCAVITSRPRFAWPMKKLSTAITRSIHAGRHSGNR